MSGWTSCWLLPLTLVVALVLFTVSGPLGPLLGLAWGFVIVPHTVGWALRHFGATDATDAETDGVGYWRTSDWRAGAR